MNLKLIYVSVVAFGVAGLIVFTYLQTYIEDQHTDSEEKIQLQIINQEFGSYSNEKSEKPREDWIAGKYFHKAIKPLIESEGYEEPNLLRGTEDLLTTIFSGDPQKVLKQLKEMNFSSNKHYLNKFFNRNNNWKATNAIQERRKKFLHDICQKHVNRTQIPLVHMVSRIYVEDKYKLLYCEVPKAGCSNWKRILMILGGLAKSAVNISHNSVHYGDHLKKLDSYNIKEILKRLKTYTKIIFVRDPMERLVSAFRDKFEHPNIYYHPVFGKAIIKKYRPNADKETLKTGSGVKFKEFIQYLLDPSRPLGMDTHWEQINKLCYPCDIGYNFIGKFETLEKDANYFLKLINAPDGLLFPHFKDRHSTDKRTNSEVVRKYLAEISATERLQVYGFYYLDYLMFNYSVPYEAFQSDVMHNRPYL
ncbi:carbohydrate sulfotransferase 9 [Notechis scutatus]|uniref:Carbohydrate sulfotransferase n=1 Tax=Notechis scutatus TaxID=8663 RepID=A0A6J1UC92_9SAUR|nr:carbohydrate sulfotransferase 9 [Notechis scutatus]XP_026526068.1 carbohydrate sulfotransferase 9 [Notechis scutatus]